MTGMTMSLILAGGQCGAYIARPGACSAPVVVVLHEIFGINDDMRQTCDELASNGFIALCPELFWRRERGVNLNHWSEAEWKKGLDLYATYDRDLGVRDIAEVVRAARGLTGASGKVGVMGFCLGALMAFLTAARGRVDAVVAYHGAETEKYLGEVDAITAPMVLHLGELDEFIAPAAQAAIKGALAGRAEDEVYSYPGCYHAFARHTGTHYDADAAALANGRSWSFLADHLS